MPDLTRGSLGMAPRPFLETTSNRPYFYIILVMMLVVYITLKLVVRSKFGLAFKAIGQNFDAARASGINPTYYRVFNFTLSAFFAGWLGGFYAHYFGSLTPETLMHTSKTVEVLAIAYIGGRGSMWGGMAIAFPFVFFIEFLRSNLTDLPGLHLVIYGVLMILVMIYYPGGLAGLYEWAKAKLVSTLLRQSKGQGGWRRSMGRIFTPSAETFPRTADAVVIGGGIVGVATAFWLSRAGLDTVLVEMRDGLSTLDHAQLHRVLSRPVHRAGHGRAGPAQHRGV